MNSLLQSCVPESWEVKKLGYLVGLRSGDAITSDSIESKGEFPVYGGNGLRGYTSVFNREGETVLIGRQGALCGNVNLASGKFWASEHAIVISPNELCSIAWLGEMLGAMNLNQYSLSAAQPGISVETITALKVPVPPIKQQKLIGDFLARETAQIDALVAEKKRMLVLIEDKRTVLISRAVTRGINPEILTRASEIDWLGDIPKHWLIE